jgi:hypothetical protein
MAAILDRFRLRQKAHLAQHLTMMDGNFNLIARPAHFFYVRAMQRLLLLLLLCAGLAGCVSMASRLDKIKVGMSREEVIRIMGKPESTMQSLQGEILRYELNESINDWMPATYYIYIANGKVKQFGRMGVPQDTK